MKIPEVFKEFFDSHKRRELNCKFVPAFPFSALRMYGAMRFTRTLCKHQHNKSR